MQHDPFLKKWNLNLLNPRVRWEGQGCWQNIRYHIAAYAIPFNLICNMTMFCKFEFDLLTPRVGGEGAGGKIFSNRLLHARLPLILYAT